MSHQLSSAVEIATSFIDGSRITAINPWGVVFKMASGNREDLSRCLQCLSIFASSAVDIPESMFQHVESLTDQFKFSITEMYPLIHAAFLCGWTRSLGRQELHGMISSVHLRLSAEICGYLNEGKVLPIM
jgi:hypothetical protein